MGTIEILCSLISEHPPPPPFPDEVRKSAEHLFQNTCDVYFVMTSKLKVSRFTFLDVYDIGL